MNSLDAKMIAKELYALLRKDLDELMPKNLLQPDEKLMNTEEAAKFMMVSTSYVRNKAKLIPCIKVGSRRRYTKALLIEYMNGNNIRRGNKN